MRPMYFSTEIIPKLTFRLMVQKLAITGVNLSHFWLKILLFNNYYNYFEYLGSRGLFLQSKQLIKKTPYKTKIGLWFYNLIIYLWIRVNSNTEIVKNTTLRFFFT